jgi:hypothetical protein
MTHTEAEALPFGVGGGLVAIKTLLSRDPCVHANTAIEMIDAILKEHPVAQHQCKWPTCQSEEYQQALAEQINQELVTGAAQPAPVQTATWQPIETAPKDFVTEFDGWNGKRVPDVSWARPEFNQRGDYAWCVQQYENGYGWANVEVKGLTHWRPIPAAPKKGQP